MLLNKSECKNNPNIAKQEFCVFLVNSVVSRESWFLREFCFFFLSLILFFSREFYFPLNFVIARKSWFNALMNSLLFSCKFYGFLANFVFFRVNSPLTSQILLLISLFSRVLGGHRPNGRRIPSDHKDNQEERAPI